MTLRRRVLGYLAVAAIASCALTVGFGVVLVRHRVAQQQYNALRNQADVLAFVAGHPHAQQAGDHVFRVDAQHPHLVRSRFAALVVRSVPTGGDAEGRVTLQGRAFLYVSRETARGRVILLRRASVRFAQWEPFLEALVLAGIAGSLLAVLLALVLSRRLTRPIDSLARATHRLAAGEPDVAVPVRGSDELADLGRSFNAMAVELAAAREAQRTFLESVSHELKTPLTSVRGYAEALGEGAVDPGEAGEVIGAEAARLQRLVFDLLDLARLGRADFAVATVPVDLGAVARDAARRHEVRARELGVRLTLRPAPETAGGTAAVLADADRLLQAVSNLIENALRLTPAGGEVIVEVDDGELAVSDTGPGLEQADLDRAFERFYLHDRYRADPGRAVGSGLGLAIVARLVGAMGGSVRAENRPQGGARFRLCLPPAPRVQPAGARAGARAGRGDA